MVEMLGIGIRGYILTKLGIERLATLEADMKYVKKAVENHIPTAIADLDRRVQKINLRLAYASGALFVLLTLVQIAINKWGG